MCKASFVGMIYRHCKPNYASELILLYSATNNQTVMHRNAAKQAKYMRQSTSISGLGTAAFSTSVKGMMDIHALFSCYVPVDKLQPCTAVDQYSEYESIKMSNWYFTPKKDVLTEHSIWYWYQSQGDTDMHSWQSVYTYRTEQSSVLWMSHLFRWWSQVSLPNF